MELEKALLSALEPDEIPVKGVWVGPTWTVVEGMGVGMANTFSTGGKNQLVEGEDLHELTIHELAGRMVSLDTVEASCGVAALNSCHSPGSNAISGNVSSLIKSEARGKVVAVVGRFRFSAELQKVAKKVYLMEMDPKRGEYPPEACEDILPGSDVNVITASALMNHTLERLLRLGGGGLNIVLGPSTPFSPTMFEFGADVLAGVRVVDGELLVSSVTRGAKRFRDIKGIEPVWVRKGKA
jgi:uncharacterized protein (DUF4213/DUF364 family)